MQQSSLVEHAAKKGEVKVREKFEPIVVEVNGVNLHFIKVSTCGPVTWIHLIEPVSGIHGFGGSKQSPQDKYSYEHGFGVAQGRAEKAIRLKKAGKTITHPYMA